MRISGKQNESNKSVLDVCQATGEVGDDSVLRQWGTFVVSFKYLRSSCGSTVDFLP